MSWLLAISCCLTVASPTLAQNFNGINSAFNDRPTFFEDGFDLMEEEIRRLESPPQQPTLIVQDDLLQWQPTIVREAGVGLWMPQGVMTKETELLKTAAGEWEFDVLASHVASARYLVAHSPLPPEERDPQTLLEGVRDGIASRTDYDLLGDRPIAFQDRYPGREFQLLGDGEQVTFRAYAIGDRMIVLAGGQPEIQQNTEAIESFLNSLQLLQ